MDWLPINWTLIKNPWNWGIIILMVLIGAVGADIILTGIHNSTQGDTAQ